MFHAGMNVTVAVLSRVSVTKPQTCDPVTHPHPSPYICGCVKYFFIHSYTGMENRSSNSSDD